MEAAQSLPPDAAYQGDLRLHVRTYHLITDMRRS